MNDRSTQGFHAASRRILYLIGQLSAGGAERQLLYLLQTMARERCRPAVAVWNYRKEDVFVSQIERLGVPVYSLGTQSGPVRQLQVLRRLIRHLRPEVIHSYSFFTNLAAHLGAIGTGAISIGSVRGDYLEDVRSAGRLRGYLNASCPRFQIYNSVAALDAARASLRIKQPGVAVVIRNGLDLQRFRYDSQLPAHTPPTVLGVGSLLPSKRWDRLLSAAAQLKQRGLVCRVEIAGEGPMRPSLDALARRLGLSDQVRFLGHVDLIEERLHASSLLAHPSDSEGCPNAVMEAMACGRAVVATDAGDVPLLVDDGATGFVVSRQDDNAFVARLETLVENGIACSAMGRAGRVKAEREFGLQRLVTETFAAYKAAGWNDSGVASSRRAIRERPCGRDAAPPGPTAARPQSPEAAVDNGVSTPVG
jgi:glycosyltransferase involved in cell wall biosynthesis